MLVLASNAVSQQAWSTHAAEYLLLQALGEANIMTLPFTLLELLCSVLAQWLQSSCGCPLGWFLWGSCWKLFNLKHVVRNALHTISCSHETVWKFASCLGCGSDQGRLQLSHSAHFYCLEVFLLADLLSSHSFMQLAFGSSFLFILKLDCFRYSELQNMALIWVRIDDGWVMLVLEF